jgi:hypothetical protein
MALRIILSACVLIMLAACEPDAAMPGAGKAVTAADQKTSADIHAALLTPGSDALYAVEADAPATDEGWAAAQAAAAKVIEGAALMQTGHRPAGRPDWIRISKAVEDAAKRAQDAVRKKDIDALAAADGDFTAQCEDCHNAFRDAEGHGMMSDPAR